MADFACFAEGLRSHPSKAYWPTVLTVPATCQCRFLDLLSHCATLNQSGCRSVDIAPSVPSRLGLSPQARTNPPNVKTKHLTEVASVWLKTHTRAESARARLASIAQNGLQ